MHMLPTLETPSAADAQKLPSCRVAAGVILDHQGRILLTRRPDGRHLGGYWEFPGGKLEPGEEGAAALARELREEIAIEIDPAWCEPIISRAFPYPHLLVRLTMYLVRLREPVTVRNRQVSDHRWVDADALETFTLPPPNVELLPAIRDHFRSHPAASTPH